MIIERIDRYKNGTILTDREREEKYRKVFFLNHCPVCGLKRLRILTLKYYDPPKYTISCYNCEASSSLCNTKEEVMNAKIWK